VTIGQTVLIDRTAIHRDTTVFGPDADAFNPHRETPSRIAPYGLAFGGGRHQCIGKPLVSDVRPAGTVSRVAPSQQSSRPCTNTA